MRFADYRSLFALSILMLLGTGGCQSEASGPLPAGPGVATECDLAPWLAQATSTRRCGCLMNFNVASPLGSYYTWGLAGRDLSQCAEVDVRGCQGAAQDFNGKRVIIIGKLIERDERHMPLLVAERIVPAEENGNELPDTARHVVLAPEPDPATGQFDPTEEFHAADSRVPVVDAAKSGDSARSNPG
jgi:hypothetical protein